MHKSVLDIASYILEKIDAPVGVMKLQKLVFFSQAWSMVWDDEPIFPEETQAWVNGPVVPELYRAHRGNFQIESGDIAGYPDNLSEQNKETIDQVLGHYGKYTTQQLIDLTHEGEPWLNARKGYRSNERCDVVIPVSAMQEYYSGLYNS